MIPFPIILWKSLEGEPRMRGDDPQAATVIDALKA